MDIQISQFQTSDTEPVVALWQSCGLTRPWNDPYRDIARKQLVQPELFLVVRDGASVVATIMAASTGIVAGSITLRWPVRTAAAGLVGR